MRDSIEVERFIAYPDKMHGTPPFVLATGDSTTSASGAKGTFMSMNPLRAYARIFHVHKSETVGNGIDGIRGRRRLVAGRGFEPLTFGL